jgi:hypothetical protein
MQPSVLASESIYDFKPVWHFLRGRRVIVRLTVSCEDSFERAIKHGLEIGNLLWRTTLHLVYCLSADHLLHFPMVGKVQVSPQVWVQVVHVVSGRNRNRSFISVPSKDQLLRSKLPILTLVAKRAHDEAPAQVINQEVTQTHCPLGQIVFKPAPAKEHIAIVCGYIVA